MQVLARRAFILCALVSVPLASCALQSPADRDASVESSPKIGSEIRIALNAAGAVSWNGAEISQAQLAKKLESAGNLRPQPVVIVDEIDPKSPRASKAAFIEALNKASEYLAVAVVGGM